MFPVQIGNEADVKQYAETLIRGERQLLITEEGNMYITSGRGTYSEANGNNAAKNIEKINEVLTSVTTSISNITSDMSDGFESANAKLQEINDELISINEELETLVSCTNDIEDEIVSINVAVDNLKEAYDSLVLPGTKVTVNIKENGIVKTVTVQEAIDKLFDGSFIPPISHDKKPICGAFKSGQAKCGSANKSVCGNFKCGNSKVGTSKA